MLSCQALGPQQQLYPYNSNRYNQSSTSNGQNSFQYTSNQFQHDIQVPPIRQSLGTAYNWSISSHTSSFCAENQSTNLEDADQLDMVNKRQESNMGTGYTKVWRNAMTGKPPREDSVVHRYRKMCNFKWSPEKAKTITEVGKEMDSIVQEVDEQFLKGERFEERKRFFKTAYEIKEKYATKLAKYRKVYHENKHSAVDNDSKHKSKSTKAWMTQKNMLNNVMECPASSPDINVIENVWASMKYYLESTVKPKLKEELVNGIKQFWENLSAEQCARYIDHIHRVLPVVVLNGGPSGF
ncbi:unnamed protein product [Mytilus edulis]|uniref:Tc1-like transposase DDE domain-containing protein n=1 Tax=Mytilus edulis TaxID=6550 RepID=A0A8S3QDF1_MYTED|nr:unnamed protein product [Mytilus edulis]